ncbi:MAG: N-acetylmuramoyl-L-alanine amidase [Actinomycetota bacterium]
MNGRVPLIACVLLLSACGGAERPVLTNQGLPEDEPEAEESTEEVLSATPTDEPADPSGLPSLDDLGDLPPAVVSPSGVIVAVVGPSPSGGLTVQTPCGNEASLAWGQPVIGADIVLDPGHGGPGDENEGAKGPSGETEAELNLDVARRAAVLLGGLGYEVVLTRTDDYEVPISTRTALADQLDATALVSIHHNAPTPDPGPDNGPGSEVYVQAASDESRRLGGLMYEEALAALSVFDADWASRDDAGVLSVLNSDGEDYYAINRLAETPAVLVEFAYISNPTEALVLGTDEYRQSAAQSVADAVDRFATTTDDGSGFVDNPRLIPSSPGGSGSPPEGCVDPDLE